MSRVDQEKYLKRYISGEKKKRRKENSAYKSRVKIIDDDVDVIKSRLDYEDDLILTGEDAPQIVGIIDDRPPELKTIEDFRSNDKWKSVSKNQNIFQEDDKASEISSLVSKNFNVNKKKVETLHKRRNKIYFESISQKKTNSSKSERNSDSQSKQLKEKGMESNIQKGCSLLYNDDLSPRRKHRRNSDDLSPQRKEGRNKTQQKKSLDLLSMNISNSYEKILSPKKSRHGSDGSSRRKKKIPRESRSAVADPKSNAIRNNIKKSFTGKNYDHYQRGALSTTRIVRSRSSDYAPLRIRESIKKHRINSVDLSPSHNYTKQSSPVSHCSGRGINDYGSKVSMNKDEADSARSNKINSNGNVREEKRKIGRTLDGKMAGLQDAKSLKSETEVFRKKENELFKKMSSGVCGKNAEIIVRDNRRKIVAEIQREQEIEQEKTNREREKQEAYNCWGVGLKQIQNYQNKIFDEIIEIRKPLARYSDDADLDAMLKDKEREGDPMLAYIREKNKEIKKNSNTPIVPIYKEPFPENRFNIRPGYRWDGVDRSNGYEKKWFDNQNQKKAVQEEAYKYSIEDM